MEGHGRLEDDLDPNVRGTLDYVLRAEPESRFAAWRGADGQWLAQDGVWVVGNSPANSWPSVLPLTPGSHGAYPGVFGPELTIGSALAEHYGGYDPVVLVKVAVGGRSLRYDFRPPSAGPVDGRETGELYHAIVDEMRAVMAGVGSSGELPALQGLPAVLEGFFWFQGWNDLDQPEGYGELLVHLINDLRSDLSVSDLPVVVAETGNGYDGAREQLVAEQRQATEVTSASAFVPTRSYLRAVTDSPNDALHHWHDNAITYLEVGEAMGQAMIPLLNV